MYDLFFENHLSKQTVFLSKHNLELVIFFLARSYYGVYSYLRLFLGPRFNSLRTTPMHVFSANRFGRGCRLDGSGSDITVPDHGNFVRSRTRNGFTVYSGPYSRSRRFAEDRAPSPAFLTIRGG